MRKRQLISTFRNDQSKKLTELVMDPVLDYDN